MSDCTCLTPDPEPTAEGILYCRICAERIPDPAHERDRRILLAVARKVKDHDQQLADQASSNGASPHPPELADEIAERVRLAPKRIALTYKEAARSLGMGETSFRQYVLPHVRIFREGTLRLVPVGELERFLEERAERPLTDQIPD